jgi:hypothetical protein
MVERIVHHPCIVFEAFPLDIHLRAKIAELRP